jgi:hypothetical protein
MASALFLQTDSAGSIPSEMGKLNYPLFVLDLQQRGVKPNSRARVINGKERHECPECQL